MISSFSNLIGLELIHVLKNMNAGKAHWTFPFFMESDFYFDWCSIHANPQWLENLEFWIQGLIGLSSFNRDTVLSQHHWLLSSFQAAGWISSSWEPPGEAEGEAALLWVVAKAQKKQGSIVVLMDIMIIMIIIVIIVIITIMIMIIFLTRWRRPTGGWRKLWWSWTPSSTDSHSSCEWMDGWMLILWSAKFTKKEASIVKISNFSHIFPQIPTWHPPAMEAMVAISRKGQLAKNDIWGNPSPHFWRWIGFYCQWPTLLFSPESPILQGNIFCAGTKK